MDMPRALTPGERSLLLWVLPEDRPGYRNVRERVERGEVLGEGRRGEGHLIIAPRGEEVDHDSPLPQVLAYGVVTYERGETSVLVREPLGEQVDVEITVGAEGAERGRWSLSEWLPSQACPQCGAMPREIVGRTRAGTTVALAICSGDKRLWVYDAATGVNHPIPMTLFYSELMRVTRMKDPSIALDPSRLFSHAGTFGDDDLLRAFITYNDIRSKVSTEDRLVLPDRPTGLFQKLFSLLRRRP